MKRTQYLNISTGTPRGGSTGHGESSTDIEEYLEPLNRVRGRALSVWGVADGLRVTATAPAATPTGVIVGVGVAIDGAGRLVVVEDKGVAITDPDVDPDAMTNVPTAPVAADGVVVETKDRTGELLLTVTWREVQVGAATAPLLLHAPWLRLLDPSGFVDDGTQVVLARVRLGGAGAVDAVEGGARRVAGVPAGRVQLRATRVAPGGLDLEQVAVAEVRARADGGLDIGLPGSAAALSVAGGDVLLAPGAGRVGIGTSNPATALHVEGSEVHSGGPAGGLSFADRSATGFVEQPAAGERWVWYARNGAARLWSGTDRLTVGPTGVDVTGALRASSVAAPAGAVLNGVSAGTVGVSPAGDPQRMDYPYPYETVGVSRPEFNLRLQSPNSIIMHTYDPTTRAYAPQLSITGSGSFARLVVGPGSNGSLRVRHIDGKGAGSDADDGLYLNYSTGQPVHVGGGARADLTVHGGINWDEEHADQGYLRLGRVQMAWGTGSFPNQSGQTLHRVDFHPAFADTPAVSATIDDPGYGLSTLLAGVGAYEVDGGGFHVLYKCNQGRGGTIRFSWFAVGRWA